jgi:hypothetical protein
MASNTLAENIAELSDRDLIPIHIADWESLTGIGRNTLEAETRAGRLSYCNIRGKKYITRAQIAAWLKRIEVPARES